MPDPVAGEVEAFYASYLDAFNRRDGDAFVAAFSYPCGLVFGNAMSVQSDEADMRAFFDSAIKGLQSVGWTHSTVGSVHVWSYSDVLAMVVADISRHGEDGSAFDRGRACYLVGRGPDGWKILTLTEMKPPYADQPFQV